MKADAFRETRQRANASASTVSGPPEAEGTRPPYPRGDRGVTPHATPLAVGDGGSNPPARGGTSTAKVTSPLRGWRRLERYAR